MALKPSFLHAKDQTETSGLTSLTPMNVWPRPQSAWAGEQGHWEEQHLSKTTRGCAEAEAQSQVAESDRP